MKYFKQTEHDLMPVEINLTDLLRSIYSQCVAYPEITGMWATRNYSAEGNVYVFIKENKHIQT